MDAPPPPTSTSSSSEHNDNEVGEDCVDGVQEVSEVQATVSDQRQCLYHSLHAPHFFCTRSRAHYLADWCGKNISLVDMNDPAVRAKTFVDWKVKNPSAGDMAEYGFVRASTYKDNTKCVYCGLVLHKWEEGDDPEEDHYYNAPFCKFVRYHMQRECEREEEERKKNPKYSYSKHRSRALNKEGNNKDGVFAERDAFFLRYGPVQDLTWDEVKALCSA